MNWESLATAPAPLIDLAIGCAVAGACWAAGARNASTARRRSILAAGLVLAIALLTALDAGLKPDGLSKSIALNWAFDAPYFAVDSLSAPLLVLTALIFFMTPVVTIRTKMPRFSFAGAMASEAGAIATIGCREPMMIAVLLAVGSLLPVFEMRARQRPTRLFVMHMGLFGALLIVGVQIAPQSAWGGVLIALAVAIRSGLAPFHLWVVDLLEHATFGRCLLFITPLPAVYALCRLLLPVAGDDVLRWLGWLALASAVYAAGMSLVQTELRRFFGYFFISHSALVLVGMETGTRLGVAGALSVWFSSGAALAGLGLTLRALEARHGQLSLDRHHGVHSLGSPLGAWFLVSGLACVGFPGTFGFVGAEILLDASLASNPAIGVLLVIATALNGISVVRAYLRLFAGKRPATWLPETPSRRERIGAYAFTALLVLLGIYPQPMISSRFHAASKLLDQRAARLPVAPAGTTGPATLSSSASR